MFLNIDVGMEDKVMEQLAAVEEVKAIYFVYGPYDIVVKVNAKDIEAIRGVIREKVRKIDGIRSTTTLIVAKSYAKR